MQRTIERIPESDAEKAVSRWSMHQNAVAAGVRFESPYWDGENGFSVIARDDDLQLIADFYRQLRGESLASELERIRSEESFGSCLGSGGCEARFAIRPLNWVRKDNGDYVAATIVKPIIVYQTKSYSPSGKESWLWTQFSVNGIFESSADAMEDAEKFWREWLIKGTLIGE